MGQWQRSRNRIADLQKKLTECLNRPAQVVEAPAAAPVATFYFPVGSSRLNRVDANVLKAVAAEINANPNASYDVIGWADTFTGTDAINARLRTNRANAVVNHATVKIDFVAVVAHAVAFTRFGVQACLAYAGLDELVAFKRIGLSGPEITIPYGMTRSAGYFSSVIVLRDEYHILAVVLCTYTTPLIRTMFREDSWKIVNFAQNQIGII